MKINQDKKVQKILTEFFEKMGIGMDAERKEDGDNLMVNLVPEDDKLTSLLIGFRGENLAALQHLLRILVRKNIEEPVRLIIDINGYREKQLEMLKTMVIGLAERVKKTHRVELLRPMSAFERRAVHMVISEVPGVATQSVGEEPNRRVIIRPEG